MRPENFNIHELIDSLVGTCMSMQEAINQIDSEMNEEDLTSNDLQTIDENIFQCTCCSWWNEIEEANESEDGNVCNDCKETDEEE